MKLIRVHQFGDPGVLSYEDAPLPTPAVGQVRVKVRAAGVNYIDTYQRSGLYRMALPFTPGQEAVGMVDAVGDGVDGVHIGDRVAFAFVQGAYADYVVVNVEKLVRLSPEDDDLLAVASMTQGMTAHYLSHDTFPLQPGQTALIHAAAGGTGMMLVQFAKMRGARVIGTVSTPEKAEWALENGADEVILYTVQDFVAEVKRLTDGKGVDVVYDSVGKDTFEGSLNCLRPRGFMVLFGQSSGAVPPVDPQTLAGKGSLFLTRPTLGNYTHTREEMLMRAEAVLGSIRSGALKVHIDRTFPLEEAAAAHTAISSRATKGKILLIPGSP